MIDASLASVAERWRVATIVNLGRARQDGFQALGGETGNEEAIRIRDNAPGSIFEITTHPDTAQPAAPGNAMSVTCETFGSQAGVA